MILYQLIRFINYFFQAYQLVLVVYALLSWFPGARESSLGQFINRLARPYLNIFDQLIPPVGGISFNVIIALFVLQIIQYGVLTVIRYLIMAVR